MSESTKETENTLEVGSRVRRSTGKGAIGTVLDIRTEVTATGGETAEKGLMVVIAWDNGTQSYTTPSGLEVVAKG